MLNDIQKRFAMFLFLCVPTRLYLSYFAKGATANQLKAIGYIAAIVGVGFMTIYATGSRKTGLETQGAKIWWDSLRPVHGILYLLFAYLAMKGDRSAYKLLVADVIIGLLSFISYHYREGNFGKLLEN